MVDALKEYANLHPFSMDDLLDMMNGQEPVVGDRPEHVIMIPYGYRVVYSIEDQPVGRIKHISVSVDDSKALPSIPALAEIAGLFGFDPSLQQHQISIQGPEGGHQWIDIWNPLSV
jgi:hypothetical protein